MTDFHAFHMRRLVKSLPFHAPEVGKYYPFRAEPTPHRLGYTSTIRFNGSSAKLTCSKTRWRSINCLFNACMMHMMSLGQLRQPLNLPFTSSKMTPSGRNKVNWTLLWASPSAFPRPHLSQKWGRRSRDVKWKFICVICNFYCYHY